MNTTSTTGANFGTCWSNPGTDLTMPAVMATGFQVVAEAILRRWATTRGQLIDDPDYGFALNDMIGSDLGPGDLDYAQQQAGDEAQKDERVQSAVVTLSLNNATQMLTVTANIGTAAGPFQFVAAVSAIGIVLLQVSP